MKNVKLLALFLMTLITCSCQTTGEFFNRPNVSLSINNECTAYQNGELIDATNYISVSPDDYNLMQDYYSDKEYRLMICLKFPRRCR
jgi:hypothetical protein